MQCIATSPFLRADANSVAALINPLQSCVPYGDAILKNNSLISKIYSGKKIKERHRHRYEVNIKYKDDFEKKGLIFSALSPDGMLPEIIELKDHPWFVGVQFHPEFRSRPFIPHPLFSSFVKAVENKKGRN